MSCVVGLDPGLDGCVAILRSGHLPELHPMPTCMFGGKRREIDPVALAALLPSDTSVVGLELVNANGSAFGAASAFTFGGAYFACVAVVKLANLPLLRVRPQEWKARLLNGTDKSKQAAIARAKDLFPGVDLVLPRKRVESHDAAEAILIGEYARLYLAEGKT